jgi:signal transduction histidine kinase
MQANALAQWAHDLRNTLGTAALCLEPLECRAEPNLGPIITRTHALLQKATAMCADLMREAGQGKSGGKRKFDVMQTVFEVVDLIAPIVPEQTTLRVVAHGPHYVMANPQDMFRILFNLIHNAVGLARASGTVRNIALSLEPDGATVRIRIADDGPGLPDAVKARLFRRAESGTGGTGYGLSIARELAERNGAFLDLSDGARGTEFTIVLQGTGMVHPNKGAGAARAMAKAA